MLSTFLGALPSDNAYEAHSVIRDTCSIPGLAQLTQRGPGADEIGRMLGLISATTGEFAGETTARGWRVTAGRGRDMRRADSYLSNDIEHAHEVFDGFTGTFQLSAIGPISLAAQIELATGEKFLADRGALCELVGAHFEGIQRLGEQITSRLPGAEVVFALDEPLFGRVRDGAIKTQSGYRRYEPIAQIELVELLTATMKLGPIWFNFGEDVAAISGIRTGQVAGFVISQSMLSAPNFDLLGELVEAKQELVLRTDAPSIREIVEGQKLIANQIGFSLETWISQTNLGVPVLAQDNEMSGFQARIELINKAITALNEESM